MGAARLGKDRRAAAALDGRGNPERRNRLR